MALPHLSLVVSHIVETENGLIKLYQISLFFSKILIRQTVSQLLVRSTTYTPPLYRTNTNLRVILRTLVTFYNQPQIGKLHEAGSHG